MTSFHDAIIAKGVTDQQAQRREKARIAAQLRPTAKLRRFPIKPNLPLADYIKQFDSDNNLTSVDYVFPPPCDFGADEPGEIDDLL